MEPELKHSNASASQMVFILQNYLPFQEPNGKNLICIPYQLIPLSRLIINGVNLSYFNTQKNQLLCPGCVS